MFLLILYLHEKAVVYVLCRSPSWLSLNSHWVLHYALNQFWIPLLQNHLVTFFLVHTPISLPYKSQTLSHTTPFLDAEAHLYIVASYVEFSLFSKITSPSLSHLFPVSYLLPRNKPDRNGAQYESIYFVNFHPRAQLKTTLDLTWL